MVQLHGGGLRTTTTTTTTSATGTMITTTFLVKPHHYSDAVAEAKCDVSGKCQFSHIPRVIRLYKYTIHFLYKHKIEKIIFIINFTLYDDTTRKILQPYIKATNQPATHYPVPSLWKSHLPAIHNTLYASC